MAWPPLLNPVMSRDSKLSRSGHGQGRQTPSYATQLLIATIRRRKRTTKASTRAKTPLTIMNLDHSLKPKDPQSGINSAHNLFNLLYAYGIAKESASVLVSYETNLLNTLPSLITSVNLTVHCWRPLHIKPN